MTSLLRQVETLAQEMNAIAVEEIQLEYGPLADVVPNQLESEFEQLKLTSDLYRNATLTIREAGLRAECLDCRAVSQLAGTLFLCTECSSTSMRVLRDDFVRLVDVRLQFNDAGGPPGSSRTSER